jgi:glycerol-3-phosphate dehydrogenase (NAD(P)+)
LARNRYFRSFVNTDVIGTEFGGVLKNLIAVAIGIVDGVGYGENTKASIITRGLVEMTDFAVAHGAQSETLSGLAGLGDLIATCQSPLSRNNTAGRLLGQGYQFDDVVKQMQQTAEGLASVAPVLELARAKGVAMPIVEQVKQVLDGTLDPKDIAPHLTTDDDEPQGERSNDDAQDRSGGALWRPFKRALDQLRNGGRRPRGDRP